jgi:predicted metalloprotease with PDZ domain
MFSRVLIAAGLAATATLPMDVTAQQTRVYSTQPSRAFAYAFEDDADRAVIGITTSTGSARDTLGVLVTTVAPRSPAERAGIEEGNRIQSINGVNLKLAPADVGDWDMSDVMSRRLTRELGKAKAGDEVDLRVYSSGQVRSVKVKTVTYDSLYPSTTRRIRRDEDERAVLGVSLGSTGSRRDTLGVLIMGLDDDGPAAKAGLEEGNRIQRIGTTDLRVSRDDAGDDMISGVKVQRLQREMEKLKPGDEVELTVYGGGRTRTLKIKTVAASSLARQSRSTMIWGGTPRAFTAPRVPSVPQIERFMTPTPRITRITM